MRDLGQILGRRANGWGAPLLPVPPRGARALRRWAASWTPLPSMKATGTATYAYGLLERKTRPAVERAPAGLPGLGPLRALPVSDGLWLLAAPAPLARYGAEPIERGLRDLDWVSACAMGHERVAEHFLGQGTLLPMKLFTLFTSEEAAVAHSRGDVRRVTRLRERLRGRAEWGIRLRRRDDAAPARRPAAKARSGREFLERKAELRELSRGERSGDRARAARVLKTLRKLAAAHVLKELPAEAGRLLLDAVLLVDRSKTALLRRTVAQEERALAREGIDLVLTGPWPAYHFLGARP